MGSAFNPWSARFEALLDVDTIRDRVAVEVPPLVGLHRLPIELATKQLERSLKTVFYPTAQCIAILQRLVGAAYAHCVITYSSPKAFMAGVYAKEAPLEKFASPICITGLSGTGKTELLMAFRRLQSADSTLIVDPNHSSFPLNGAWLATVQARSTPKDILTALAGSTGKPSDLVGECRKLAFRNGVPLLCADEFQFATGSSSANVIVTQMLFALAYIGIPFVFVANFSLYRRLQKRPEEDRQRFLAKPIVVLPDPWSSEDWLMTLRVQQGVAPNFLQFDPVAHAKELHAFSAGRKRAMANLILIAYQSEHSRGGVVDIAALRRAYKSAEFAECREESEILATQAIRNAPNRKRMDLWCPISLPEDATVKFLSSTTQARGELVAEAELRAALTGGERKTADEIERAITKRGAKAGTVVQLAKSKNATSEELRRNANWLKENL